MNLDKLFHAYDIRGIYPKPLNKEFAYKLGKALVVFLKKQFSGKISVIVGRDGRFSSLPLYKSFSKGIIKQGANLINIGQVASDSLYFALNHLKKQAGVMITGSHNPKDYNGFKIVLKGPWYLSGESGLPELKEIIKKDQFPKNSKKGDIKGYNIISEYKNHILSLFNIDDIKKKNIVVDAANGVAYKAIKKIALDIPVNLDCIYCNLDDDFSHHSPDPIKFKNIKDLCKRVKT